MRKDILRLKYLKQYDMRETVTLSKDYIVGGLYGLINVLGKTNYDIAKTAWIFVYQANVPALCALLQMLRQSDDINHLRLPNVASMDGVTYPYKNLAAEIDDTLMRLGVDVNKRWVA